MDKNVVLARKYGRAIYEIAAEQNSLEKTGEELHLIADTITGNAELKQLLFHPLLAKDVKKDTLNKLFADKQKVDSALIGGFTVQVGDRLIDGSVARQLQTLKHIMKQRD